MQEKCAFFQPSIGTVTDTKSILNGSFENTYAIGPGFYLVQRLSSLL
jgi:hypothetical protein